jgi:hypothetical protein
VQFFPLRLGVPKRKAREERESESPLRTYDDWRKWISQPEEFDPHPAEDVLSCWMRGDPTLPKGPWLITGEPGAGKTSLLEHWHQTWLRAAPALPRDETSGFGAAQGLFAQNI